MANISGMELQNLRHLIQFSDTDYQKYSTYAEQSSDSSVKQFFQQAASSAQQNKQTFEQFLN